MLGAQQLPDSVSIDGGFYDRKRKDRKTQSAATATTLSTLALVALVIGRSTPATALCKESPGHRFGASVFGALGTSPHGTLGSLDVRTYVAVLL